MGMLMMRFISTKIPLTLIPPQPALVIVISDNYYRKISPIRGNRISDEQRKHKEFSAWGMPSEMSASLDWLRENPFGLLGVSRDFSAS